MIVFVIKYENEEEQEGQNNVEFHDPFFSFRNIFILKKDWREMLMDRNEYAFLELESWKNLWILIVTWIFT